MQEWECSVCGYKHKADEFIIDSCPVCAAGKSVFKALNTAEKDKQEVSETKLWRCTVCDYIHKGSEPPETCPVCGADRSAFEPYSEKTEKAQPSAAAAASSGEEKTAESSVSESPLNLVEEQILKHHLHPISVHFPNGIVPVIVLFVLLAAVFDSAALRLAAYLNISIVFLSMPLVLYTGFVEWQRRYKGAQTSVFKIKIAAAAISLACIIILLVWRSISENAGGFIYILLHLILLASVGIAGHLGGKLVFAARK